MKFLIFLPASGGKMADCFSVFYTLPTAMVALQGHTDKKIIIKHLPTNALNLHAGMCAANKI